MAAAVQDHLVSVCMCRLQAHTSPSFNCCNIIGACIVVCVDVLCAGAATRHDVLRGWPVLLCVTCCVYTKCCDITDCDGVQIESLGGTDCHSAVCSLHCRPSRSTSHSLWLAPILCQHCLFTCPAMTVTGSMNVCCLIKHISESQKRLCGS